MALAGYEFINPAKSGSGPIWKIGIQYIRTDKQLSKLLSPQQVIWLFCSTSNQTAVRHKFCASDYFSIYTQHLSHASATKQV